MDLAPDGSLATKGRVSAGGRSTCYLTMLASGKFLAAVNYWDSIVALLPIGASDGLVAPVVDAHMQPAAEYVFRTNPDRVEHWAHRQRWPHTHCFVTEPYDGGAFHLVPDLGRDIIWAYQVDAARGKLVLCGGTQLEVLQGPRHLIFHPTQRTAYVINGKTRHYTLDVERGLFGFDRSLFFHERPWLTYGLPFHFHFHISRMPLDLLFKSSSRRFRCCITTPSL
jgi:6-phosphogluconolactonase (cycloisomerase 2 family)